mmetsp:Transcript_38609/g.129118  ORF Transcript_38609/g.129118 Transcript_38609/m.129118 type:complete len:205 (-) Transcript_38609:234-848(-)
MRRCHDVVRRRRRAGARLGGRGAPLDGGGVGRVAVPLPPDRDAVQPQQLERGCHPGAGGGPRRPRQLAPPPPALRQPAHARPARPQLRPRPAPEGQHPLDQGLEFREYDPRQQRHHHAVRPRRLRRHHRFWRPLQRRRRQVPEAELLRQRRKVLALRRRGRGGGRAAGRAAGRHEARVAERARRPPRGGVALLGRARRRGAGAH